MEIIGIILFLILPIIKYYLEYIGDNTKVKSNNDFINHLAEVFHNEIGVKIYD